MILGGGRFEVLRQLGEGGFGAVYAVYDRERKAEVALKRLTQLDPHMLFVFKQEFRSLANVHHPNLIGLHELFADGDQWFFTMELIAGQPFVQWVRGQARVEWSKGDPATHTDTANGVPEPRVLTKDTGSLDETRLRPALLQLVDGISALHFAGKLHCDLKPSNVLVTPEGRVVILDFGLVRDTDAKPVGPTMGTPSYMSPEQALGEQLSQASDWYSIGVILHEALTGRLPFEGHPVEILQRKLSEEAPPLTGPEIPSDLAAIASDLLRRQPRERPSATRVRGWLSAARIEDEAPQILVGRAAELARLRGSLRRAVSWSPERVFVVGPSGVGKSALLRAFLGSVNGALVLTSTCYEQESVAYKGVDGLVDSLTRWLLGLAPVEQASYLGDDVGALAETFPVLKQLEQPGVTYPQRRARDAFKAILRRIGERVPVVLHIDNAQWGDHDSAHMLSQLLAPPAPRALLLVSARDHSGPLMATLTQTDSGVEDLPLAPLDIATSVELATKLIGGTDARADRIAKEARRDPLLIETLARDAREQHEIVPSLELAVRRRLDRLEPETRRLCELIACAGTPIETGVLFRASPRGAEPRLAELFRQKLVRGRTARAASFVEAAHDRIKNIVLDRLPSYARRVHHATLAEVMESAGGFGAELIGVHWQAAGDDVRAADHFVRAAEAAERVLAFDRAARLYQLALNMAPKSRSAELYARVGEVMVATDKPDEAREAFLSAAALSDATQARFLEQRVAALRPPR